MSRGQPPKVECTGCSHNKSKIGGQQAHHLLLNHRLIMQSNVWEFTNKVGLQEINIMGFDDEVVRDLPWGSKAIFKNGQELVRTKLDGSLRCCTLNFFRLRGKQSKHRYMFHPSTYFHPFYIHVHWIWNLG